MDFVRRLAVCLVFLLLIQPVFAGIRHDHVVPPPFQIGDKTITPSKISEIKVHYTFDVAKQKVFAHAQVKFSAISDGFPFMDLIPTPQKVTLNMKPMNPSDFYEVKTPKRETTVRVLNQQFKAGEKGILDIDYEVNKNVVFGSGMVGASFFMSDLEDRGFFERYGPSNFEFDHIAFTLDVDVVGSNKPHEIFANGATTKDPDRDHWHITFPDFYTSSSIFFHLAPVGTFAIERDVYHSINNKDIPMTFFSRNASLAKQGLENAKKYLTEFEGLFGAYGHDHVIVYMTPGGGGMEYPGAATSSLRALRHELNHSWYARCIMPASGNAGWIDEAIASWSDDGFPRANKLPNRKAVNMAGMHTYTRATNMLAYTLGRDFISELDLLFKDIGGMKKFLRLYYATYKYQVISTEMFQKLAEEFYGQSLSSLFNRYVYGIDGKLQVNASAADISRAIEAINPYHAQLSDEELHQLILPNSRKH